ncbi:hypothetical protein [Bradyrhizobium sp. Arg816]|uniref:hypothetical protein n=1 Tax=Bradyrhizobium sp. Arg816 TaxID=2998491 RepID=UPI00249F5720|nr:hypothetical protein [Bradyrhizobium sp. Arg816]MDI3560156.1 hypothetical protein [Bradyrhizobium sp. Arg816]
MNGLFERLAKRATLSTPVLERRPRAIFEPTGPRGSARIENVEAETFAEAAPSLAAMSAPAAPPAPRITSPTPVIERSEHGFEQARGPDRPPPATAARRVMPVPPPAAARAAQLVPARTELAPPQRPASQAAGARAAEAPPPARQTPPPAPIVERRTEVERRIEVHHTTRETNAKAALPQAPPQGARPSHVTLPPVRPQAVLQASARPTPATQIARARALAAPPAPAAAPLVQLSIGRLEVRAPAPEKRAAAKAAARPRLSLEAYLDGRRGGER